jgi:hypothetical protein
MRTLLITIAAILIVMGTGTWLFLTFRSQPSSDSPVPQASRPMSARMGPLEPATNRQGRDLSVAGIHAASAQQCSDLCAADNHCMSMSFAKTSGSNAGICFLKGSVPSPSPNDAMISAVKGGAIAADRRADAPDLAV